MLTCLVCLLIAVLGGQPLKVREQRFGDTLGTRLDVLCFSGRGIESFKRKAGPKSVCG